MNKPTVKRSLVAVGLLALIGAVGAETYYTHEVAQKERAEPPATWAEPGEGWWDPWAGLHADMMRMRVEMDQAFDDAFREFHARGFEGPVSEAKITLDEKPDKYIVKAQIPGADKNDIRINLDGRLLSISSRIQGTEEQTADNGQVTRRESYARSFERAFTLPGPVNATAMHSDFQDGVLTVTLPKEKG
jgi:HSP20 family protein